MIITIINMVLWLMAAIKHIWRWTTAWPLMYAIMLYTPLYFILIALPIGMVPVQIFQIVYLIGLLSVFMTSKLLFYEERWLLRRRLKNYIIIIIVIGISLWNTRYLGRVLIAATQICMAYEIVKHAYMHWIETKTKDWFAIVLAIDFIATYLHVISVIFESLSKLIEKMMVFQITEIILIIALMFLTPAQNKKGSFHG